MKRFNKIGFLLTAVLCGWLASCTSEADQQLYAGQEKLIEEIIETQLKEHPEFILTSNGGSERLTVKKGEGEALTKDGTVSFYYAGHTLSRRGTTKETLFATNHEGLAKEYGWKTDNENAFDIVTLSMKKDKPLKGLENGLVGVQPGEECFILFTTEYAFGDQKMNGIPINSGLIYHIWVESVEN